jgi:DNA repair protein RAD50
MQVSGIRLFDPNDAAVIKFCPLTLILGVNGAGKTTLIEALRYATSGETPPGSEKGKLWITDPTLLTNHVS